MEFRVDKTRYESDRPALEMPFASQMNKKGLTDRKQPSRWLESRIWNFSEHRREESRPLIRR